MNTKQVLSNLRKSAEDHSADWSEVYLDNAVPVGMSDKSFRSTLAILSKAGFYKVIDGYAWGKVKMKD